MITKTVVVTQRVRVTVDETKFDADFMSEFRSTHYDFRTLDDHVAHLGQLFARGIVPERTDCFIEGYGNAREMGIRFEVENRSTETEIAS